MAGEAKRRKAWLSVCEAVCRMENKPFLAEEHDWGLRGFKHKKLPDNPANPGMKINRHTRRAMTLLVRQGTDVNMAYAKAMRMV